MRKLKRLASLLLALVMCFGLTSTAFAADTYTITINNSTEKYEYYAYQIFKGDYSSGKLSNVEWGDDIDSASLLTALQAANTDPDSVLYGLFTGIDDNSTAEDIANILAGTSFTNNSATTQAFAVLVEDCITGNGTEIPYDSSSQTYTETGFEGGYYLIVNTKVPDGDGTSYSRYMLRIVSDVNINPKSSAPTSEKQVGDVNDSESTTVTNGSTASYDIGDDVPFILTAEVPTTFGDYSTYKLTFHDTLTSGLSFNNDVVVTITDSSGNVLVTVPVTTTVDGSTHTNYTVVADSVSLTDGCSFEVVFTDLNDLYDSDGNKITLVATNRVKVSYSAKLSDGAVFQETNAMHVEYSNNPYDEKDTGTTPEDIVTVFTFELVVTKTGDTTTNEITGATFTLYKYDVSANDYVLVETIVGTDTSKFTFSGLDAGQYKLVETVTPTGYNTMDDLYFKVEATHTENVSTGEASVTALTVTQTDENGVALATQSQTFNASTTTGKIETTIINNSGSSLPVTGGIGTTIFYVVGGVLVVGAVVLLITKRRMNKD